MKKVNCVYCGILVEVEDDYEPEYCCSGLREQCGCMGQPINPVICDCCLDEGCRPHKPQVECEVEFDE